MSHLRQFLACSLHAKSLYERAREKKLRRQEFFCRIELVIQKRPAARIAYWQRAFRSPLVASNWIFTQAFSFWSAILYSLGLQPQINYGTLSGTGKLFMRLDR